jgi:quinol monooxygenase YgiN
MTRYTFLNLSIFSMILVACVPTLVRAQDKSGPGKGYANIPTGAYSLVADLHAKPGRADELRAATLPLLKLVRNDPKNLVYFFQEDREAPGHFIFFEVYASQADCEAHNKKPYVKAWFAKLPELADGGLKVTKMGILEPPAK